MRVPFTSGLRVGTDIVLYKRLLDPERPRQDHFLELTHRLLTLRERNALGKKFPFWKTLDSALVNERKLLAQWCGGRFAAKEAAKKAWGAHLVSWRDLVVEQDKDGAPKISCCLEQESLTQIQEAALSISHDGDYAAATVIANPLIPEISARLEQQRQDARVKVGLVRKVKTFRKDIGVSIADSSDSPEDRRDTSASGSDGFNGAGRA